MVVFLFVLFCFILFFIFVCLFYCCFVVIYLFIIIYLFLIISFRDVLDFLEEFLVGRFFFHSFFYHVVCVVFSRSEMKIRDKSVRSWCDGSSDRSFMGWTH